MYSHRTRPMRTTAMPNVMAPFSTLQWSTYVGASSLLRTDQGHQSSMEPASTAHDVCARALPAHQKGKSERANVAELQHVRDSCCCALASRPSDRSATRCSPRRASIIVWLQPPERPLCCSVCTFTLPATQQPQLQRACGSGRKARHPCSIVRQRTSPSGLRYSPPHHLAPGVVSAMLAQQRAAPGTSRPSGHTLGQQQAAHRQLSVLGHCSSSSVAQRAAPQVLPGWSRLSSSSGGSALQQQRRHKLQRWRCQAASASMALPSDDGSADRTGGAARARSRSTPTQEQIEPLPGAAFSIANKRWLMLHVLCSVHAAPAPSSGTGVARCAARTAHHRAGQAAGAGLLPHLLHPGSAALHHHVHHGPLRAAV